MAGTQGKNYTAGDSKKQDILNNNNNKKQTDINWNMVREEWVTTNISLSGLAVKYAEEGVTLAKLRRRHARDNWSKDLAEYNNMVSEEIERARREKATYLASRVIALDELVMTTSEKVVDIINYEVEKIHPDNRIEDKEVDISILKETSSALKQASDALKNSHYNIRLACDKATSIIDERGQQKSKLDEDDVNRIAKEMDFLKNNHDNVNGKTGDSEKS
jgi:hypothetical protein